MGKWSETQHQQAANKAELKEKDKISRETLGKYFYDLSKLAFAAMCLGGGVALVNDIHSAGHWVLVGLGAIFSASFARIGFNILKR